MKYNSIPLNEIFEACEKYELVPLQEDNTRWSGILCGDEAVCYFTLGWKSSEIEKDNCKFYTPMNNTCLTVSWYRFTSGRYEINTYLG